MVQTKITEIFKVGILTTKLNININLLNNLCNNIEESQESIYVSNSGYQSTIDRDKDSIILELKKQVLLQASQYIDYLGYRAESLEMKNLWLNVNYYKDFNLPHNHGADLVSGVFYVKVPENSGNIVFQNSSEFLQFNNDNIKNFNEYNSTTWSFIPKNQELFLFPSWINHYVQPNLNKKEKRISIAFNINTK